MKKILISIALCLGLFSLSTDVYAQGTPASAVEQSVGAFHGFQVDLNAGNHYEWNVYEVDATGAFDAATTAATDKYKFYNYDPTKTDITEKYTGTGVDTYEGEDFHKVGIQWLDVNTTGKVYAIEVAEFNGASGTCSTKRRYFISVSAGGVDFMIAALNAENNNEITGVPAVADLTRCNSFTGGILAHSYVDADAKKLALGTTSVYYKISMNTGTQEWNGAWGFDYSLTNDFGTDLAIAVLDAVDGATVGAANTGTSKITVNTGNPVAYLKVTFQNVLGTPAAADITFNLSEKNSGAATGNTTAFITAGTQQFETVANKADNKVTTDFVIKASPETSLFTVE